MTSHKLEVIYRRIWFTYSLAITCNHRPKLISSGRRGRGKGQKGRIRGAGRRELSCSCRLQPMKNIIWFSLRILLFDLSVPWIFNVWLEQNGVGVSVVSIQGSGCQHWLGGAGRSERWEKGRKRLTGYARFCYCSTWRGRPGKGCWLSMCSSLPVLVSVGQ